MAILLQSWHHLLSGLPIKHPSWSYWFNSCSTDSILHPGAGEIFLKHMSDHVSTPFKTFYWLPMAVRNIQILHTGLQILESLTTVYLYFSHNFHLPCSHHFRCNGLLSTLHAPQVDSTSGAAYKLLLFQNALPPDLYMCGSFLPLTSLPKIASL